MTPRMQLAPLDKRSRRRRAARRVMAGIAAVIAAFATSAAEARCVRAGQIFSCAALSGEHALLSCFGTGVGVQTCIDSAGHSLYVGTHWHSLNASPTQPAAASGTAITDDASFSAELSNALAANPAFGSSTAATSPQKKNTSSTSKPPAR
jgi:hypothetical protein